MYTMHGELKSLLEFPIRIKVEYKAVQNILEKGPEKNSSQEQPGDGLKIRPYPQTLVKGQHTVRNEHSKHGAGTDTAQPLK